VLAPPVAAHALLTGCDPAAVGPAALEPIAPTMPVAARLS
jgi:hypothetical protein